MAGRRQLLVSGYQSAGLRRVFSLGQKLTAKRLLAEAGTIEDTYLLILSRPPSESELLSTQTFLDSFSSDQRTEAWTQLTQALFSTVDFRFID